MSDIAKPVFIFDGANFDDFKFRMLLHLDSMDLKKFVEQPTPPTENQNAVWRKGNTSCKLQIANHLGNSQLHSIKDKDFARDMWDALIHKYERKTVISKMVLISKLINMKMSENDNMQVHLDKFETLMRECQIAGIKWDEEYWPCFLLATLPSTYEMVTTALETGNTMLNLRDVKLSLLDFSAKIRKESDASVNLCAQKKPNYEADSKNPNNKAYRGNHRGRSNHRGGNRGGYRGRSGHRGRGDGHRGRGDGHRGGYRSGRPNNSRGSFRSAPYSRENKYYDNYVNHRYSIDKRYKNEDECWEARRNDLDRRYNDACEYRDRNKARESGDGAHVTDYVGREVNSVVPSTSKNTVSFYIDSGSTDHIINNSAFLSSIRTLNNPIHLNVAKNEVGFIA